MSSLKYYIWLSCVKGMRANTIPRLLEHFGTPEQIFFAGDSEYSRVDGLSRAEAAGLNSKSLGQAAAIIEHCKQHGYTMVTIQDAAYPERLRNIYDPPCVLYVKGSLPAVDEEVCIGIVGTRRCTQYGVTSAEKLGRGLAAAGGIVITGLAKGIDTAAARGALRAGGRVIGVIGSGLDTVYPHENKQLFDEVAKNGAIISEFIPEAPVTGANFPIRNRIISGLSLGVAVVEAPAKSGALITASRALEQGRDVFAIPGNVDLPTFMGSNSLLKEGAIPLTGAEDIIREYADLYPGMHEAEQEKPPVRHKIEIDNAKPIEYSNVIKEPDDLDGDEKSVYLPLMKGTMHVDDIIMTTGLPAHAVLSALTMLEIKGYVRQDTGKRFTAEKVTKQR